MQSLTNEALPMATMTIRNIDDKLKTRLRVQAAQHGRSMEDEARDILRTALSIEPATGASLFAAIRAIVEPIGGAELDLPPREAGREPPDFSGPEYDRPEHEE